jgi:4-hydroxy-tetrahydrodipicolinate synthase
VTDRSRFRGLAVAMVTPMHPHGDVDRVALREHAEFLIAGGVDVLVPCGTTGESATLHFREQAEVIAEVTAVANKRVPVMAGAGTNHTEDAVKLARAARDAGADAILSVGPYYNRPTQEGLYRHFSEVARSTELPVFIYNVPGRTGSNILPETVLRLARDMDTVAGVKEASGDLAQMGTLLRERPDDFLVLAGDDEMALPVMALGGDGVVSVAGNEVPQAMKELVAAGLAGDFATARTHHFRLLALMRANFVESNPIPVKTAMEIMDRFEAHMRLPLTPMEPAHRATLEAALREAGVR